MQQQSTNLSDGPAATRFLPSILRDRVAGYVARSASVDTGISLPVQAARIAAALTGATPAFAALLFIDISGFTAFVSDMQASYDSSTAAEVINANISGYFNIILQVVQHHDGDVLLFAGDAVLVGWFCDPRATSQVKSAHACCALRCGAELVALNDYSIQSTGERNGSINGDDNVTKLAVHVGCTCGDVSLVVVGDEDDAITLVTDVAMSPGSRIRSSSTNKPAMKFLVTGRAVEHAGKLAAAARRHQMSIDSHMVKLAVRLGLKVRRTTKSHVLHEGSPIGADEARTVGGSMPSATATETPSKPATEICSPQPEAPPSPASNQLDLTVSGISVHDGTINSIDQGTKTVASRGSLSSDEQRRTAGGLDASNFVNLVLQRFLGPEIPRSWSFGESPNTKLSTSLSIRGGQMRHVAVVFARFVCEGPRYYAGNRPNKNQTTDAHNAFNGISLFYQSQAKAAQLYSGVLNKFHEDDKGLIGMTIFGLPQCAVDDPDTSALRFAHRIASSSKFVAAVGLCDGGAYCGVSGGSTRSDFTVLGEPVNTAARLMTKAVSLLRGSSVVLASGPAVEFLGSEFSHPGRHSVTSGGAVYTALKLNLEASVWRQNDRWNCGSTTASQRSWDQSQSTALRTPQSRWAGRLKLPDINSCSSGTAEEDGSPELEEGGGGSGGQWARCLVLGRQRELELVRVLLRQSLKPMAEQTSWVDVSVNVVAFVGDHLSGKTTLAFEVATTVIDELEFRGKFTALLCTVRQTEDTAEEEMGVLNRRDSDCSTVALPATCPSAAVHAISTLLHKVRDAGLIREVVASLQTQFETHCFNRCILEWARAAASLGPEEMSLPPRTANETTEEEELQFFKTDTTVAVATAIVALVTSCCRLLGTTPLLVVDGCQWVDPVLAAVSRTLVEACYPVALFTRPVGQRTVIQKLLRLGAVEQLGNGTEDVDSCDSAIDQSQAHVDHVPCEALLLRYFNSNEIAGVRSFPGSIVERKASQERRSVIGQDGSSLPASPGGNQLETSEEDKLRIPACVTLLPVDKEASAEMARRLLNCSSLSDALFSELMAASGGSLGLLEQVVVHLVNSNRIVVDPADGTAMLAPDSSAPLSAVVGDLAASSPSYYTSSTFNNRNQSVAPMRMSSIPWKLKTVVLQQADNLQTHHPLCAVTLQLFAAESLISGGDVDGNCGGGGRLSVNGSVVASALRLCSDGQPTDPTPDSCIAALLTTHQVVVVSNSTSTQRRAPGNDGQRQQLSSMHYEFRIPLAAAAVYNAMLPSQRHRVHCALALATHSQHSPSTSIAVHGRNARRTLHHLERVLDCEGRGAGTTRAHSYKSSNTFRGRCSRCDKRSCSPRCLFSQVQMFLTPTAGRLTRDDRTLTDPMMYAVAVRSAVQLTAVGDYDAAQRCLDIAAAVARWAADPSALASLVRAHSNFPYINDLASTCGGRATLMSLTLVIPVVELCLSASRGDYATSLQRATVLLVHCLRLPVRPPTFDIGMPSCLAEPAHKDSRRLLASLCGGSRGGGADDAGSRCLSNICALTYTMVSSCAMRAGDMRTVQWAAKEARRYHLPPSEATSIQGVDRNHSPHQMSFFHLPLLAAAITDEFTGVCFQITTTRVECRNIAEDAHKALSWAIDSTVCDRSLRTREALEQAARLAQRCDPAVSLYVRCVAILVAQLGDLHHGGRASCTTHAASVINSSFSSAPQNVPPKDDPLLRLLCDYCGVGGEASRRLPTDDVIRRLQRNAKQRNVGEGVRDVECVRTQAEASEKYIGLLALALLSHCSTNEPIRSNQMQFSCFHASAGRTTESQRNLLISFVQAAFPSKTIYDFQWPGCCVNSRGVDIAQSSRRNGLVAFG